MDKLYIFLAVVSIIGLGAMFYSEGSVLARVGWTLPDQSVNVGYAYRSPVRVMADQATTGLYPEVCTNGIDDDLDGAVDCEDSECVADLRCRGGCRVTQYDIRKPGSRMCMNGQRVECMGTQWQIAPCPAGQQCWGRGDCQ